MILTMNYRNFITIEPNKRGGKPCVRGLRITVYEVLEYLASEMTEAEILDDFPDLTREDLKACIAYAADRERRFATAPLFLSAEDSPAIAPLSLIHCSITRRQAR
jgi:uncharacterized protein (DUF433 family)